MSEYSIVQDFRDLLADVFSNSWNDFQERTQGIIYKENTYGQLEVVDFKRPADLIPYYPYVVTSYSVDMTDGHVTIYLSNQSHNDKVIDDMEDMNEKYSVKGSFEPFNTEKLRQKKVELQELYNKAIAENINFII